MTQSTQLAPEPTTALRRPRAAIFLTVTIVLLAAGIRVPGLFTDFWFDEIWSWFALTKLHSIADILLSEPAQIDNNHPLNTLWLYLLGQNAPVYLYRLPALLFGASTVILAAHIMWRRGAIESILAAILVGFSYPLVFYSSEARGYSGVVFFAFLAFDALELACPTPAVPPADPPRIPVPVQLTFWIACILGFLSHLTFLHAYLGAFLVSVTWCFFYLPTMKHRIGWLLQMHLIPAVAAAVLFVVFVSHMRIGGALPTSPLHVVLASISQTVGGPDGGTVAIVAAIAGAVVFSVSLIYPSGKMSFLGIFSFVAVVLSPVLICGEEFMLSPRPQPLMVRYFLICLAIGLLPVAHLLANIWRSNTAGKIGVFVAMGLFFAGNIRQISLFFAGGRGHYSAAISDIAASDHDPIIHVTSDNPIRTQCLLEFYAQRIIRGRSMELSKEPGRWLILNRGENTGLSELNFQGMQYNLVGIYHYAGLSGWAWHVYRRTDGVVISRLHEH